MISAKISALLLFAITLLASFSLIPVFAQPRKGAMLDDWWQEFVESPDLRLEAFERGDIDVHTCTKDDVSELTGLGYQITGTETGIFAHIYFNTKNYPLNITSVRKALCYTFDKEDVVTTIFGETYSVQHSPFMYTLPDWYNTEVPEYGLDLEFADILLDQTHPWVPGDPPRFTLDVPT